MDSILNFLCEGKRFRFALVKFMADLRNVCLLSQADPIWWARAKFSTRAGALGSLGEASRRAFAQVTSVRVDEIVVLIVRSSLIGTR